MQDKFKWLHCMGWGFVGAAIFYVGVLSVGWYSHRVVYDLKRGDIIAVNSYFGPGGAVGGLGYLLVWEDQKIRADEYGLYSRYFRIPVKASKFIIVALKDTQYIAVKSQAQEDYHIDIESKIVCHLDRNDIHSEWQYK